MICTLKCKGKCVYVYVYMCMDMCMDMHVSQQQYDSSRMKHDKCSYNKYTPEMLLWQCLRCCV